MQVANLGARQNKSELIPLEARGLNERIVISLHPAHRLFYL